MLRLPTLPHTTALIWGLLLVCSRPPLQAQPPIVELSGIIVEAGSAPLAGVTVELISGGLRLVQATGPDGRFQFCCLPAGKFRMSFRHPRASRPGEFELTLFPHKQYRISAVLNGDSAAGWTLGEDPPHEGIEATSTRTYTRLNIGRMPSTLHLWTLLGNAEVSITPERLDVAGIHGDETMLFGSRGGSWSQNRILWDGFNLTASDGARTLLLPDLSMLESVTYTAFGEGLSLPGAELQLQPRHGGPAHHGQAHVFFQCGALQNVNITERLRDFGITDSDERYRYSAQGNAQMGGPFTSNWTYYGAVSRLQSEKWIRNHPLRVGATLTSGTVNFLGDISTRDRLGLTWLGQQWHQPEEGASPQVAREATRNTSRTFQSVHGFWTRTVSSRSLLDARAAFSVGRIDASLQPDANRPAREELFPSYVDIHSVPSAESGRTLVALWNNVWTGAAPLAVANRDWRLQLRLQFHTLLSSPETFSHRLSFGFDGEWLGTREQAHAFQDIHERFFRGRPDSVQRFNRADSYNSSAHAQWYAGYNISIGALTFSLSGQASWAQGSNRRITGAQGNHLQWTNAGGQAGIGYRIGHRYPTVLRADLAHRYQESLMRALKAVHPDGLGIFTHSWSDSNQDGSFQPDELGRLLKVEGAPFSRPASHLKQPYTREVHLEAAQELPWKFILSVHAYRRVEHQLLVLENTGVAQDAYSAFEVFDPGNDGANQTGDEGLLVAYNQDFKTLGKDAYLLASPADAGAFAEGYEGRVTQTGRRLQWEVAVTRYRAVARTAPGNGPLQNDWSVFAVINDPNQAINAYGSTFFDRGLAARFRGTWQLGFAQFGWITSYLDGAPYGRLLPVSGLNQGLVGILATQRGPGDGSVIGGKRTAHSLTTAVRLSRGFRLKRGHLDATLDVFNLLNAANTLRETDVTSPTHFWRIPLSFQAPRSLQLGLRFNW